MAGVEFNGGKKNMIRVNIMRKVKLVYFCLLLCAMLGANTSNVEAGDFDFAVEEWVDEEVELEDDVLADEEYEEVVEEVEEFEDEGNKPEFIPEGEIDEGAPVAISRKTSKVVGSKELFDKLKYGQKIRMDDVEGWLFNTSDVNECLENGKTMLLQMVAYSSNIEAIALLIDHGAILATTCQPNYNALFVAAQNNKSPAVVDLLITKGADIVVEDYEGNTALSVAAASNPSGGVVETLLEYGLKINKPNKRGHTPLMLAAFKNDIKVVRELLKNGANVNLEDKNGRTALMAAALRGDDDIMQLLIKHGANFKVVDKNKMSVLDYYNKNKYLKDEAYTENKYASISEVLEYRYGYVSDNHYKYNKDLRDAVFDDEAEAKVDEAIKRLADINSLDEYGCTPLINAARNDKSLKVFELLVEGGADVNASCLEKITPLMFVSTLAQDKERAKVAIEKLKLLNDYKLDIDLADEGGNTALMYALQSGANINFVASLLALNADVNVVNKRGETPLWIAVKRNLGIKIIEMLIEFGADVNAKALDGETILWHMLKNGESSEKIVLLLESGIDTSVVNPTGKTPLWYLLLNGGRADILNALIKFEKNLNEPNAVGDTPLLFAVKNDYPAEIIKSMLYYGADPEMRDANGMNTMDIMSQNRFFDMTIKEQTRAKVLNQW
ncbi:MAG: ankyrin repeat domain-containing protein [Alphaproteobacteria bacterium]|nr:ankyrin repeat domain-containing protein [Alphaproteobacteria bacterium]